MKTWSEGLDQEFNRMTSGSNDITGAYQLQQVSKEKCYNRIKLTEYEFLKVFMINDFINFVASIGVSTEIQWADSKNGWKTNSTRYERKNGTDI